MNNFIKFKRLFTKYIFKFLPLEVRLKFYKNTGKTDIRGVPILEGSIIKAKVRKLGVYSGSLIDESAPTKTPIYCVIKSNGVYGSCIIGAFEPLERYRDINVLGHVENYRDFVTKNKISIPGNFMEALK